MYTLNLDEEQIKVYVTGLDSSIKLIGNQLSQGVQGNSAIVLKNLLSQLISINQELSKLDLIINQRKAQEAVDKK